MKLKEILKFLSEEKIAYECICNAENEDIVTISRISSLKNIKPNALCWIKNETYINDRLIEKIKEANAVIVTPFVIKDVHCIVTEYPKRTYFAILNKFFATKLERSISKSATVLSKSIGKNVYIGSGAFICEDVIIGDNTVIHSNVNIICPCVIGKDCIIYPGTVIGSDGFGYYFDDEGFPIKVEHFGGVSIGDRVEIGANACIDRGTIDDTVICDDVKIDNLVHIAHNSVLNKGAMIIAGAVVCGSVEIGQKCYIAPGAIIKNQICVEENALVGLGAVVTKNVSKNMVVTGIPAKEIRPIKKGDK